MGPGYAITGARAEPPKPFQMPRIVLTLNQGIVKTRIIAFKTLGDKKPGAIDDARIKVNHQIANTSVNLQKLLDGNALKVRITEVSPLTAPRLLATDRLLAFFCGWICIL